ncbi:DUF3093 domain-containing protein [Microbacterium azadirachtae]|uniref:DUF3093 domain-containing protein n=1 Tax=Microbacterium azadirachtae TaxID=582680 RepID=UPI00088D5B45|nr:DUF3093 domain-containing protein [Microbacterium azadirachtae]SDL29150.1 Protein of unknown function [Microbacterium azadirachtae]SEF59108.1 Protein of unknown function [Microbacterium azadirachtae]SEF59800.1 Protein of unknown function [Microbacterium azadirachtae]
MQNAPGDARPATVAVRYRERLAPSLWLFLAAALGGPMLALVFVPAGSAVALVIGVVATIAIIALMILGSPRVEVDGRLLRAGRAWIDASWLGEPEIRTGEEARQARGPALPARGWHLIRGGIDGVVVVPNIDPADPAPSWTISTRTPDRLAAAIDAARAAATTSA